VIVIDRPRVAVWAGVPLSVTPIVNPAVPPVVGVPEMTPVLELRVSPAGSEPDAIDHVYGLVPPVADSVWL
jgi:hypothetical protein